MPWQTGQSWHTTALPTPSCAPHVGQPWAPPAPGVGAGSGDPAAYPWVLAQPPRASSRRAASSATEPTGGCSWSATRPHLLVGDEAHPQQPTAHGRTLDHASLQN